MSKLPPISDQKRAQAIAAVAAAWRSGCPVAGWRPEDQAAIAEVCLRRHRSLARRGVATDDRAAQVKDLARGMAEISGEDIKLIGPLMRDYEWLAEQVLEAIGS